MFLTRSEYDHGVNTFSPEGRLFQVEYAIEAIKVTNNSNPIYYNDKNNFIYFIRNKIQLGSTAIGIKTPEGVVLAVEKRVTSTLIIPNSIEKIVEVDSHICKQTLVINFIYSEILSYIFPLTLSMRHERFDRRLKDSH
jgi:20S proteasome subunit alpha 5